MSSLDPDSSRQTTTHASSGTEVGDISGPDASERPLEPKPLSPEPVSLAVDSAQVQANQGKVEEQQPSPELVGWDDNDPENPQNFSLKRKILITGVSCLLTANVTFASSAPSGAVLQIAATFGVSLEASTLITSIFLCGYIFGPIIWGPCSEIIGRRPVFTWTVFIYTLLQLGPALGTNFATVIVVRFLGGLFAAAPLTNAGGTMADIWGPAHRGIAMALFSASAFIGPVIGPVVGGYVLESLGWRWIFWIMMILGGVCWIPAVAFLPETHGNTLLIKRARRLRKLDPVKNGHRYAAGEKVEFSVKTLLERTLFRPFIMLATEPILLLVTIYLSLVYGILYALFSVFPIVWQELRGFDEGKGGLIFIGVGIGTTLGAFLSIYMQRNYHRLVAKWHGVPPPEKRLPEAMIAGPCVVIGIFWLGWTGGFPHIPWYVPALSTIPLGMSFTLIFISLTSYIVDTYLMFAASALAANTMLRSAVGMAFPLFTEQMFHRLHVQWACTLLGCFAVLMAPMPYIFYKYGSTIRQRSSFAPCIDLKMKARVEQEEREAQEKGRNIPV